MSYLLKNRLKYQKGWSKSWRLKLDICMKMNIIDTFQLPKQTFTH